MSRKIRDDGWADAATAGENVDAGTRDLPLGDPGVSLAAAYWRINANRSTPPCVIEAIIVAVRERGLGALKEPKIAQWLNECDEKRKAEVHARIKTLNAKGMIGKGKQ